MNPSPLPPSTPGAEPAPPKRFRILRGIGQVFSPVGMVKNGLYGVRWLSGIVLSLLLGIVTRLPKLPEVIEIKQRLTFEHVFAVGWAWFAFPAVLILFYRDSFWWWVDFALSWMPVATMIGTIFFVNALYKRQNPPPPSAGSSSDSGVKTAIIVGLLTLMGFSVMAPTLAFAAPNFISSLTTPDTNDASICALEQIFGEPVIAYVMQSPPTGCTPLGNQTVLSGVHSALAAGFQIYAAACFALVGFIFSWWWFVALISGASSGSVGHSKINPVWAPIRFTLGMTMLAPSSAALGICTVQMVALYIAIQGVGIADNVLNAIIPAFLNGITVSSQSVDNTQAVLEFDADLEEMLVCTEYFNIEGQLAKQANPSASYYEVQENIQVAGSLPSSVQINDAGSGIPSSGAIPSSSAVSFSGTTYDFDLESYTGGTSLNAIPQACGQVLVYPISQAPNSMTTGELTTYSKSLDTAIFNAENTYVQNTITALTPSAQQIAMLFINPSASGLGGASSLTTSQIQSAAATAVGALTSFQSTYGGVIWNQAAQYNAQIAAAVATANPGNPFSTMATDLAQNGWANFGAFFYNMAVMSKITYSAATSVPQASVGAFTGGSFNKIDSPLAKEVVELLDNSSSDISNYLVKNPNPTTAASTASSSPSTSCAPSSSSAPATSYPGISGWLAGNVINAFTATQCTGALDEIIHVGNVLEGSGEILLLASGASWVANKSGVSGGVSKWVAGVGGPGGLGLKIMGKMLKAMDSSTAHTIEEWLIISGLMLNTIIPFMPGMLWIIFYVGWLVLVIEAVIAAPIWAVSHSLPEGEGISGSNARQGYLLLLNICFRPVLGVFGLLVTIETLEVVYGIVLESYKIVVTTVISTNTFALFDFFAITVAYVFLMLTLTYKSCELITLVPTKVMRWIGGNGDDGINSSGLGGQFASNVKSLGGQTFRALSNAGREFRSRDPGQNRPEPPESVSAHQV